tara:strand:+ start:295 stop:615 length:321 start_codon:yes stop_codon:yes gene_type:complete
VQSAGTEPVFGTGEARSLAFLGTLLHAAGDFAQLDQTGKAAFWAWMQPGKALAKAAFISCDKGAQGGFDEIVFLSVQFQQARVPGAFLRCQVTGDIFVVDEAIGVK